MHVLPLPFGLALALIPRREADKIRALEEMRPILRKAIRPRDEFLGDVRSLYLRDHVQVRRETFYTPGDVRLNLELVAQVPRLDDDVDEANEVVTQTASDDPEMACAASLGRSWQQIAKLLGVSKRAVQQKYGRGERRPRRRLRRGCSTTLAPSTCRACSSATPDGAAAQPPSTEVVARLFPRRKKSDLTG